MIFVVQVTKNNTKIIKIYNNKKINNYDNN